MKLLLDQGLPRSTVGYLERLGLQAEHVGDLGLATATDETILATGRERGAVVITLDSDFHALLALSNSSSPSVVRIRVQGMKGYVLNKSGYRGCLSCFIDTKSTTRRSRN